MAVYGSLLVGWEASALSMNGASFWYQNVFAGVGTDWLAFAHLAIAVFFIGPLMDPVRNVWVLWAGLIACLGILPLALICGEIRGIPMGWRLIDCSFGVFGALPLIFCLRRIRELQQPSSH